MLVLTRKTEEQIRIGNDITISIVRVKGNTVRVGIEAPREIRVVRGELAPSDAEADGNPGRSEEPFEVATSPSSAAESDGTPGESASPAPATTAVREFIANRARRRSRGARSHRPGNKSLAEALTRSA